MILKRENWLWCLFLDVITLGLFTFYIAKVLDVYDENEWYSNISYWIIGFLFGIIPAIVMFILFFIQIGCKTSQKLSVPFDNYYTYPYIWLLLFIVPIVGWALFIVLFIYVHFWYIFYLKRGYGEEFIK